MHGRGKGPTAAELPSLQALAPLRWVLEKSHPITRPVVFVHGVRTSSAIWSPQLDAMSRHGHHAVAIDLPAHGTRAGDRFTWDGALAVIDEAVSACAEPPLLVGLSLGGYISLAYAARNEGRLAGLVLAACSTEIRGKPVGAYRRVAHRLRRAMNDDGGSWDIVTDMLGVMKGYSSLADLRRLGVPVWLVNGRRDPLRLDERRLAGTRPGTRLSVVPRAGHDVNSHAPAAFNRIVLDALRELRLPTERLASLPTPRRVFVPLPIPVGS
jgi:pimeloyl-ACP methyl ester carboxylesterase